MKYRPSLRLVVVGIEKEPSGYPRLQSPTFIGNQYLSILYIVWKRVFLKNKESLGFLFENGIYPFYISAVSLLLSKIKKFYDNYG